MSLADLKGLKLRAPNRTVASAIEFAGATPVILQVNQVMAAVKKGEIDGIVTNWANPLPDFNAHMKKHTDTKFYSAAFFVVMNKAKYAGVDRRRSRRGRCDVRGAGSQNWAGSGTNGRGRCAAAQAPGHEIIVPDAATMTAWRQGLKPVTDKYLDELARSGFPGAHAAYRKVAEPAP